MIIAFHGTSEENVESILGEGFRVGTYFAHHIGEARHYGSCIFAVEFREDGFEGDDDGWQFHLRDPLAPSAIRWHQLPGKGVTLNMRFCRAWNKEATVCGEPTVMIVKHNNNYGNPDIPCCEKCVEQYRVAAAEGQWLFWSWSPPTRRREAVEHTRRKLHEEAQNN